MQQGTDDIDGLFRRAADNYPLNTDSADWNGLDRKLSIARSVNTINASAKNKSKKHLLWLLLLLPISWLYYDYKLENNVQPGYTTPKKAYKTPVITPLNIKPTATVVVPLNLPEKDPSPFNHPSSKKVNGKEKLQTAISEYAIDSDLHRNNSGTTISDPDIVKNKIKTIPQLSTTNESINNQRETAAVDEIGNKNTGIITPHEQSEDKPTKDLPKKLHNKPERRFYAGIIISPEISIVKFQSIKNTGLSIGGLIGFQFNNKLSFESGIAWSKKYYYSKGKYFNTKNVTLPNYAKVIELDGLCEMIEVPLSIRYNLKSSSNTHFSVSAGMSSYLMKKENYDYTIERGGSRYPRSASYPNSSTDLFAVAYISFGVNRNVGKNAVIRLEPYIKLPVKGVGIGNLPITSSGINLAITKKIF